MRHPRPQALALSLAILGLAVAAPPSAALTTKELVNCQKALDARAAKLVKTRAKLLGRCAQGLLACTLRSEVEGAPLLPCQTDALADCNEDLAKSAAAAATFTAKVAEKCGVVADASLRSRRGLGFRDDADACAALVPPGTVATTAAALDCAARAAACAADDRVEETVPRAYEMLSAAGLATSAPCVDVRAPAPAGAGSTASKDLVDCQKVLDKELAKVEPLREKAIRKCSLALLACELASDRLETTFAERDACRAGRAELCNDKRAGIAEKEASRDAKLLAECGALALADLKDRLGFAATCGGAGSVAALGGCVATALEQRSERGVGTIAPRACAVLRAGGQLTDYEDTCVPSCGNGVVEGTETCDDGNADPFDECTTACLSGPTASTTALIASTADPADTPDGTPANAVPPASTLATQFGSTVFDLNRASTTRFFVPSAGDPDTVLVLVPGFAGGAGSFRGLAENLLLRAEASGQIRLEVWAYEHRTNQLEDTAGAELAEDDLDPLLALDWFFGGAMGLTLDARLSRRAVFHAGSDVAFLANFTPQVFARDIDAVIEAARALPSAPAVFLGGHSLGTLFTGRYAATDLDPGAAVVPGFSKVAGLVLLEGGGGSTPATPPTSDGLDMVIAKADGGLRDAVRDGAARCVDGTPCASDGDCVSVSVPPGALSNKCVAPVDAYTGANTSGLVFIDPQIQAAGHATGIQGVLDPDGQVVIQQNFGGGAAVDGVQGLQILSGLPRASAEAGIGFFLDDDYSPVAAFRASLGFSNNGSNSVFLGFVLPGEAFVDPYRVWINVGQPQPAAAVPHNGAPNATLTNVWGQEKEVTSLPRFFPSLFAGDIDFGDWYFPSSGLSVTSELNGTSALGGLDSTALSVGRGRPDIENLTQAAAIDVPVIAFGGSNGLTPTAANYKPFAQSIGTCTAPSCTGVTPRLVADDPITPTYGDVGGGFEVVIVEGYAHIDVVTAEDDADNGVLGPLLAFLERNTP